MSLMDEIAEQTRIRRRLLANGYTPLANKDKMCVLPAWPHIHVDGARIEAWSTQLAWRATGVRVEGGLVVIDLDIDDGDVIEEIVAALPGAAAASELPFGICEVLRRAPVRHGKGWKEAWFCRLAEGEEPFYRLASSGWRRSAEDETVHRVEIFAGASGGRQFGAYGAHTIGDDGSVAVPYEWMDDRGLCEVPFDELPTVTRAQLELVADTAAEVMRARGWVHELKSKSGYASSAPVFDLTDEMVFETRDHGPLSLAELEDVARGGDVRLSASWLEGPAAVNVTRCIASIHPVDDRISILETASFNLHRPAALAPRAPTEDAFERLRRMADSGSIFAAPAAPASVPRAEAVGAAVAGDMEAVVDALLQLYAYCPSEQRCVVPINGTADNAMSMANFVTLLAPHAVTVRGPRGGEREINPATIWRSHPARIDVDGWRFRPDLGGQQIIEEDGGRYINTFRGYAGVEVPAALLASARHAFEVLLAHLIPADDERDWLRMWLAAKIQRPWAPNCGVLLIADRQGTGRGTLFDMMQAAVGREYYRSITSVELMGGSGQGAYTGWAARSLLVTVEEIMAGNDTGGAMAWKRREAYERIKQLIDPRQRAMEIRDKFVRSYRQDVFFSLLMATNHFDALPIEHADRRIAVFVQPDITFAQAAHVREAVDPHRASGSFGDAFGAALRAHLMSVDVDFDALRVAPELGHGREMMRDSNEGDVEEILRDVLENVPGDFIANTDLRRRLQHAVTAHGEGEHLRNWWVRVQTILRQSNRYGWRAMPTRQTLVGPDGRQKLVTVYYRDATPGAREQWAETPQTMRRALLEVAADSNRMASALEAAQRRGQRVDVV